MADEYEDPLWLPAPEAVKLRASVVPEDIALGEIMGHVYADRLPLGSLCTYNASGLLTGSGTVEPWVGMLPPPEYLKYFLLGNIHALVKALPLGEVDDGSDRELGRCHVFVGRRKYAELFGATTSLPDDFAKAPPVRRVRGNAPSHQELACIFLRCIFPGLSVFEILHEVGGSRKKVWSRIADEKEKERWAELCALHGTYYDIPNYKMVCRALVLLAD